MRLSEREGCCLRCDRRTMTCHGSCEEYIRECRRFAEERAARAAQRQLENYKYEKRVRLGKRADSKHRKG